MLQVYKKCSMQAVETATAIALSVLKKGPQVLVAVSMTPMTPACPTELVGAAVGCPPTRPSTYTI